MTLVDNFSTSSPRRRPGDKAVPMTIVRKMPAPKLLDPDAPYAPFKPKSGQDSRRLITTGEEMKLAVGKELCEQLSLAAQSSGMDLGKITPYFEWKAVKNAIEEVSPRIYADPWQLREGAGMPLADGLKYAYMVERLEVRPEDRVLVFEDMSYPRFSVGVSMVIGPGGPRTGVGTYPGYVTNIVLHMLDEDGVLTAVQAGRARDESILWALHRSKAHELDAWKNFALLNGPLDRLPARPQKKGKKTEPAQYDKILILGSIYQPPEELLALLNPKGGCLVYPENSTGDRLELYDNDLAQIVKLEQRTEGRGEKVRSLYKSGLFERFNAL